MSAVDFGRYKRIVRDFFDAEPRNDDMSGSSIWCLGREYLPRLADNGHALSKEPSREKDEQSLAASDASGSYHKVELCEPENQGTGTEEKSEADGDWPVNFVEDCESRTWFTYRSGFAPIKKSSDAAMTLSVRLRSLADQQGFTSDTGWGCMIRSGQSLLANALAILRLKRGICGETEVFDGPDR